LCDFKEELESKYAIVYKEDKEKQKTKNREVYEKG